MSKPVTHSEKKITTWRNGRPIVAGRRNTAAPRVSAAPHEMSAYRAFAAATHVRKAIQRRIVRAFRRHIEGAGRGPTDAELLMFARLAIAEQRLGRSFAQAQADRYCGTGQTFGEPASVLRRGEHP
ncbi:hypothetical protein G5B35_19580 [Parapusillimonas sp. SGNA-6]|nr:hypothetical protein [Parapusillimonas sp. SGNA-6]RST56855.1 hypothetical protein EJI01_03300 [Variovorax sp. MHTC-1]